MKTKTTLALALGAVLMFAGVARADHTTVDQNGTQWRWIPGERVMEDRLVTIPGHYETRQVTMTDPGRYEMRTRQVWRPGRVTYERRTQVISGRWTISVSHGRSRYEPARTVCETVPVQSPGCWETVTEQVWVPGCTRVCEHQVWIPEHTECRKVCVEQPGRWERVQVCTPRRTCEPDAAVTLNLGGVRVRLGVR